MIENLIKLENIMINQDAKDWKEAIHLSLAKLVENGYCTEQYEQSVLESTAKYGPYYVLCPEFALIHSNCFEAVKETQFAVTVLNDAVKFSEDGDDVHILVALVAKDSSSHMEGIIAVSNIFSDEDRIEEIINAKDPKFIYDMFIAASNE